MIAAEICDGNSELHALIRRSSCVECIAVMWRSSSLASLNVFAQRPHRSEPGSSGCEPFICELYSCLVGNSCRHSSHWYFSPWWYLSSCRARAVVHANGSTQNRHLYGFSPVCERSCFFQQSLRLNVRVQYVHLNDAVAPPPEPPPLPAVEPPAERC